MISLYGNCGFAGKDGSVRSTYTYTVFDLGYTSIEGKVMAYIRHICTHKGRDT
jgi:hypothetical protein